MLRVGINGKVYELEEGLTILEALKLLGIHVPTLCYDERVEAYGGCRLCIVKVKGWPRPVASCTAPLSEGMEIETHGPDIEDERRTLLKLLARDYPPEPVRRFPELPFHRYLREYGLEKYLLGSSDSSLLDDSHPYIRVDMSQCIYCFRCVRICSELQGQFVWEVWGRGGSTRIRPDGKTLLESSCTSCGACEDSCPSGAIQDRTVLERGVPTARVRTTCPYCGTGCEMRVGVRDGEIADIKPVVESPVSKGHLCVKGRYSFGFVNARDRITEPMIRKDGLWREVSWDEAMAFTSMELKRLMERHGPHCVGVLGSSRATNEENYLAQKFARLAVGTNNVDCCARVCHTPSAAALKLMLGKGAATNSYDDIERARTLLVAGANATENHPIVGARIKEAAIRGATLIVIDPREIELARYADLHLAPRPGTDIPLLNALACTIVEEGLFDEGFIRERVSEWEEFKGFITGWRPEETAHVTGVPAELVRKAARLYSTGRPSMSVHGLGLTEHVQGTETVMALLNLALLTGNVGRPGTGINPLRGQNNVQGAAHMGCEPGSLTGGITLKDGKDLFEAVWGTALPGGKGLNLLEMMDAAAERSLKALWAIGYDVLLTNPDVHFTEKAMGNLELVIIQDMFMNETARVFGNVFLPCASSFEKDGTFMNAERRISRVRKVIPPAGNSRPDWEIIRMLAGAMGKGRHFDFSSPEHIWDEVRTVWKEAFGVTYRRLEDGGLQWPCPSEDHPGTGVLHAEGFAVGPRAGLRRVEYRPTDEATSDEFPLLMTTGRNLYQFNAGTMTMRTRNTVLRPTDLLDISPEDAGKLGLSNRETVRVGSRYGSAIIAVNISPRVRPGTVFATFNTPEVFLNRTTGPRRDRYVKTPEYKVTAVRVEKL